MMAAVPALAPRPGERMLPALSGLLLAASFPPVHLLLPPFVALVPFAVWVARLPSGAEGERAAAGGGLLLGIVLHGLTLHWILPALAWVTAWAAVAFVAAVGVLAVIAMLFGWACHRMFHRANMPIWVALPLAWTAAEFLQGHLPGPLAFPWLGLGTSLTAFPELVGVGELVGARGVTFWLALVNGLVAAVILDGAARGRTVRAAAGLAVAVLPAAWGVVRAEGLEVPVVARVAVVGTDLPAALRGDPPTWNRRAIDALRAHAPALAAERPDLVVLPEGFLMAESEDSDALVGTIGAVIPGGAAVLFGEYRTDPTTAFANLARLLRADDGAVPEPYRKRRLVPLVEWRGFDDGVAGAGPVATVFEHRGAAYGPSICFEAIFPDAARTARRAGADVLVNLSNDAWFGASGGLGRAGRDQHAAHLVMRAIEHRTGAVRSANGGHGYVVDPVGRIRAAVPPDGGVAVVEVRASERWTLFTRTGDWVGPAAALLAILGACPSLGVRPRAGSCATTRLRRAVPSGQERRRVVAGLR